MKEANSGFEFVGMIYRKSTLFLVQWFQLFLCRNEKIKLFIFFCSYIKIIATYTSRILFET